MSKLSETNEALRPSNYTLELFTRQTEHPGVESDLVSVTTYRIVLKGKEKTEPAVRGLAFDSLILSPSPSADAAAITDGKLSLKFSRVNYRAGSDYAVAYALPPSPLSTLPSNTFVLVMDVDGEMRSLELPEPETLPSLYHP